MPSWMALRRSTCGANSLSRSTSSLVLRTARCSTSFLSLTDGVCLIRTLNAEPHQREPHKQAQQQRNDEGQQPAARRHLAHARSPPLHARAGPGARRAWLRTAERAASSPESSSALTGMRIQFFFSATRSLALPARGLSMSSRSEGQTGFGVTKQAFRRMMAHAHGDVLGADAALRPSPSCGVSPPESSKEWKEIMTATRPPGFKPAEDGVEEPFQFADLVVDRHAQRLKRARGGVVPGLGPPCRRIGALHKSRQFPVVSMGLRTRASTMARAIRPACGSSP